MLIWAVIATIIAIGLVIVLFMYRRQVKRTCRQLVFIKEHDTNMKLYDESVFSELSSLKEHMNEVIASSIKIKREALQNEELLKETITNISHDIRTPLTSLDGYFQLLQQSDSEEEKEKYIAIIRERLDSLGSMLEELFTYTKIQDKDYELVLEKVDFNRCVLNSVFSFYEDFKKRGIEPQLDFTEEQQYVMGNREAIRRILENIIKNATEHGEKEICMRLFNEGDNVIFECANKLSNSENIEVDKVFERFYKSDVVRTSTSTGLGLAIAKNLTEKMNGIISAEIKNNFFVVKLSLIIKIN